MFEVNVEERSLHVLFNQEMDFLSWAIVNGGFSSGKNIFWANVTSKELPVHLSPKEVLNTRMNEVNMENSLGLMTSANLSDYVITTAEKNGLQVKVLCTVGMGNALRVGDVGKNYLSVGTINILCSINKSLSTEALIEAMSIVAEARTLAVLEENITSKVSGLKATGTGTDCIVIASEKINTEKMIYSGKHTVLAELIGKSVWSAVSTGIMKWKKRTNYGDNYIDYRGSEKWEKSVCL